MKTSTLALAAIQRATLSIADFAVAFLDLTRSDDPALQDRLDDFSIRLRADDRIAAAADYLSGASKAFLHRLLDDSVKLIDASFPREAFANELEHLLVLLRSECLQLRLDALEPSNPV